MTWQVTNSTEPILIYIPLTTASATKISELACLYWDEEQSSWMTDGCTTTADAESLSVLCSW